MIPCSTPTTTTTTAVATATQNSSLPQPQDLAHAGDVDELDADQEDDRSEQHAFGRYCSGFVRKRSTIATTTAVVSCATWVWLLRLVDHLGLRRAAVHDERAAEAGREVREAEPDEVVVLVEVLAVLDGVRARGRRALREDHEEQRDARSRASRAASLHVDALREADVRQPARDRPEDRDVVRCEVEDPAQRRSSRRRRRGRRGSP